MPDKDKKSFVLFNEYIKQFELLSREDQGDLIMLIFKYVNEIEFDISDYSDVVIIAFSFIKADIERNLKKYEKIVERRREAGLKGGAPKGNQNAKTTKNNQKQAKTSKTSYNDNVNVNVNGNVNGNVNELHSMSNICCSSSMKTTTTTTTTTFTPPTAEEITEYCKAEGLQIDSAQLFIDYNEARNWQVGRGTMKDWKANVRRWCSSPHNVPPKEKSYNIDEIEKKTLDKYRGLK